MAVVALIISIVALVVALMALPFWGRPKLIIDFGVQEVKGGKVLQGELYNDPIRSRLLQILGIRRIVAEDVVVHFNIEKDGNGSKTIAEVIPPLISHAGTAPAQRISLPPSIFPCQFGIATVDDAEALVRVFQQSTILVSGLYRVFVEVVLERKTIIARRNFNVIDKPPFAVWLV